MLRVVFINIRAPKINIFVNFYVDLHFQGHLLQELDDHMQCDFFDEYLMNIGWMGVRDIQLFFFLFFQVTRFPPGKRKLSYAATSNLGTQFIEHEYLDLN